MADSKHFLSEAEINGLLLVDSQKGRLVEKFINKFREYSYSKFKKNRTNTDRRYFAGHLAAVVYMQAVIGMSSKEIRAMLKDLEERIKEDKQKK